MVVQILGIVIACTFVLLIGLILDGTNSTMSWYKIPAIVFGLYVAPTGFSQLLSSMVTQRFMKQVGFIFSTHKVVISKFIIL